VIYSSTRLSYSIEEAAAMIGIGRTTLYGLIKTGELPIVKIGTRTLVRRSDLENLLHFDGKAAA
jgi:excisionase family DNA binding protein